MPRRAISRAREDVTIYTDDKAMLPEAMSWLDEKTAAARVNVVRQQRVRI